MKQLIFLILIISAPLFAYEFKLNQKDIKYINNSPKKSFILNRLDKFQSLKTQVKDYELIRKLSHINTFINRILPAYDISTASSLDYWATPKEFLLQGHGDCEDYVIAKYFTLLEIGIPKEKLYFAVVNVKGQKDAHMVLLYVEDKNSSPLVLDNLSSRVIPFTKRPKLIPKFAFNEIDSYLFTANKFTQKTKVNWGKDNKWEKLLNRVYNLNE
ncbi:MAG: transglutaminase-like cysteine peptidase [Arcobacter sp.]|jgi:predicted transglutaminase-like cysteine proteinase|uniref:transglutaminase-like cysteine peptidase n=1 Tax=Arcobacter sp. TaxID=1872629 RepID=UPI0025911C15|nr:transglutaminase-like cysteine peptidase [Arcobacter sp.]MDD3007608.1 transglutaminase-like cysteine peptidase [Arcobacter sp.]